jgi:pyruvate/2-oxoglutarate dehydrogenase complex dihydrolipoamide acyltransferase (E2) component
MEEGTLSKWLIKVGDQVNSGDVMAEIETDKATMEFEAVDEGVVTEILVPEGTEGVKVGAVIARLAGEGDSAKPAPKAEAAPAPAKAEPMAAAPVAAAPVATMPAAAPAVS